MHALVGITYQERAPCMIFFETEEDASGDDVSKALFTQLYAGSNEVDPGDLGASDGSDDCGADDGEEDITAIDSSDEILKYLADSPPKPRASQRPKVAATTTAPEEERKTPRAEQKPSPFLHQLLAVSSVVWRLGVERVMMLTCCS